MNQLSEGEVTASEVVSSSNQNPESKNKMIIIAVAIVIALISFFPLAGIFSNPDFYQGTIQSLDDKRGTVTGLIASTTIGAAALSAVPGDAGTPIANKLMDLDTGFIVVMAALLLEKYLLTIFGLLSFRVLVPIACLMFIVATFVKRNHEVEAMLKGLAVKFTILALALVTVVPLSVYASDLVIDIYNQSQTSVLSEVSQATEGMNADGKTDEGSPDFLQAIQSKVGGVVGGFMDAAGEKITGAQNLLNGLIESLAVMIVTTCVLPLLVIAFMIWLVGALFGVSVKVPTGTFKRR